MKDDIVAPQKDDTAEQMQQPANSVSLESISQPASPKSEINDVIQKPVVENPDKPPAAPTETDKSTAQTQPATLNDPNNVSRKPKKDRSSVVVIIFAVIIMFALIGLTVYASLKQNKNDSNTKNQQTSLGQQSQNSSVPNDKQAVDDAIKDIDALPADNDTSGTSLSDQALGL